MGNIALVICSKEGRKPATKGFISFIKYKIGSFIRNIKREKAENWLEQMQFEGSLTFLINLPYDMGELKQFNKKRIERIRRKISKVCVDRGINCCILPESLTGIFEINDIFISAFGGRLLYKSILIDLINMICRQKGVALSELDVSVISGSDYGELIRIIKRLSDFVKYLTVVADSKESIEDEMNDIFEETGLAVGITGDLKNALSNSRLIINLSKQNLKNNDYIKSKKIIINYSGDCVKGSRQDSVINGVEVKLPELYSERIKKEVYSFFSAVEIAEILICQKVNCFNVKNGENVMSTALYENINYEFLEGGYKLTGYR